MLNLDDLSDQQQERMCVLCEEYICGSRCDSKGNMCEGRWCDQAIEYLSEEVEEQNREIVNRYFKNK
jgi:hypothetical protein